jgi:hypothetical protein
VDIRGDVFGLLAAHPMTPLVSLHHLDHISPIFPNMTTIEAIEHLFEAANVDSQRILQQTICYDRWFAWTISVSWGYAVQIFPNHLYFPDALHVQETFRQWKKGNALAGVYTLNTRELHPDPCRRPTIFFLDSVYSNWDGIKSNYKKSFVNCSQDMASPRKLQEIRVFSHKLDLDIKQVLLNRFWILEVQLHTWLRIFSNFLFKLLAIQVENVRELLWGPPFQTSGWTV